eukprot:g30044.t2
MAMLVTSSWVRWRPSRCGRTAHGRGVGRCGWRNGRCNFLEHPSYQVWSAVLIAGNVLVATIELASDALHASCELIDQADIGQGVLTYSRLLRMVRLFRHASFNWTDRLSGAGLVVGEPGDLVLLCLRNHRSGALGRLSQLLHQRRGTSSGSGPPHDIFWNWMDFIIVLLGVFDLWAIPISSLLFGTTTTSGFGRLVLLVRMLRSRPACEGMLRILRLLKLVKAVRPLYSLALGVTQAMQSIFWVLVFLVVTLYAFAILATRTIGHAQFIQDRATPVGERKSLGKRDDPDLPNASRDLFRSMWDSMFALFSIMNQQNWEAMGPLLEKIPAIKPVYVLFTICSSWALLSVLTGVVSDNMMAVRESQAQKDEEAVEERRIWLARWLRGVFAAADKDGSMTLERSEYRELLKSPFHLKRLQQVAKVPMQDLMQMFDILDVDHNGLIEFQDGRSSRVPRGLRMAQRTDLREVFVEARARDQDLLQSEDLEGLRSRQMATQERLEGKFRQLVDARKKLKEEYEKTIMLEAEANGARAELAHVIGKYQDTTFEEAADSDVVIQTPEPSKVPNLRDESSKYGDSYNMMEDDDDIQRGGSSGNVRLPAAAAAAATAVRLKLWQTVAQCPKSWSGWSVNTIHEPKR